MAMEAHKNDLILDPSLDDIGLAIRGRDKTCWTTSTPVSCPLKSRRNSSLLILYVNIFISTFYYYSLITSHRDEMLFSFFF